MIPPSTFDDYLAQVVEYLELKWNTTLLEAKFIRLVRSGPQDKRALLTYIANLHTFQGYEEERHKNLIEKMFL